MEMDGALRAFGGEVGRDIVDAGSACFLYESAHSVSPFNPTRGDELNLFAKSGADTAELTDGRRENETHPGSPGGP
jgi:hypothetical protein